MGRYDFGLDSIDGMNGEKFVREKLKQLGYIIDYKLPPNKYYPDDDGGWTLSTLVKKTNETKVEPSARKYGNVAIETRSMRGGDVPSGIMLSTADSWTSCMPHFPTFGKSTIGVCDREKLLLNLKDENFYHERDKPMGDYCARLIENKKKAARGFLVKIEKFLAICDFVVVVDGVPKGYENA